MTKYYKMDLKQYEESKGFKNTLDDGSFYTIQYDGNRYYILSYPEQCFVPFERLDGEKCPDLSICEEISRDEVKDIVTERMEKTEKRYRKLLEEI